MLTAAGLLVLTATLTVSAWAQTERTLVSNLGQATSTSSFPNVGGNTTIWQIAQKFTVEPSKDYTLAAVTIDVETYSDGGISTAIHADNNGNPASSRLYALTAPSMTGVGELTYKAPANATLEKGKSYFVVLQRVRAASASKIRVSTSYTEDDSGVDRWSIANGRNYRNVRTTTSWTFVSGPIKIKISGQAIIIGTPITATLEAFDTVEREGGRLNHRFYLRLSQPVFIPFRDMRDHAFTVTNGQIVKAKRMRRRHRYHNGRWRMFSEHWRMEVRPTDMDSAVTVTLTPKACSDRGALCTKDGGVLDNAPTLDLDTEAPPLTVSINDASANEDDRHIVFDVNLSRTSPLRVEVDFRTTTEGTATAGTDFRAGQHLLAFPPGTTNHEIGVRLFDDMVDDDGETVIVELTQARLNDPYSRKDYEYLVAISDDKATGTINNTGAMPKAWLARFGRTIASQAVDAIGGRMEGGSSHLTVDGQALTLSGEPVRTEHRENTASAFGALVWPNATGETRTMTGRELLLVSSFQSSAGGEEGEPAWTAWGRFATGSFDASEDDLRIDGSVTSGFLGADVSRGRWLAGLALGLSEGNGDFSLIESDTTGPVETESSLTAYYPYARLRLGKKVDVWGLAAHGTGELTLTMRADGNRERDETVKTDIAMRMGAVGARGELLSPSETNRLMLAVKSDAFWVRMSRMRCPDSRPARPERAACVSCSGARVRSRSGAGRCRRRWSSVFGRTEAMRRPAPASRPGEAFATRGKA